MKLKRSIVSVLTILVMVCSFNRVVKADGVSFSGSTSISIYEGASTTITVKFSNAAGTVYTKSSNTNVASVNGNGQFVDSSSITITIKGISEGTSTITINGVYSGYTNPEDVSFSRTIKVTVYKKTSTSAPAGTSTPAKSSVKLLGSLEIEGLKTEEEFNSSRTEYTVYAPNGTEKINIKATPASSKAKLSSIDGAVKEGWNNIEFSCTAEDGSKQTYKIKVYVEEKPDIYFEDGKYGVVKNLDKVTAPENFELKEITIDEKEVKIFNYKGIDLIYVENEEGNKDFYIYNSEENKLECLYNPVEIDGKNYISMDLNYEDFEYLEECYNHSISYINNVKFESWTSKAENMNEYRILYLMNEEGQKQLYSYDIKEESIQRFNIPVYPVVEVEETFWDMYKETICLSAAAAGIIAFIAALIVSAKVNKSIKKISK